ncbi:N-acetylmuramoyl-L-alanine amidase [Desulfothermobacter acidiphilus]|uniref:N-acetylmuramoyl-L-alanine amidase n=1 Tax=Desulfothermobacter acidiphilus TaxID=1938353 RepID=UPI003F8A20D3
MSLAPIVTNLFSRISEAAEDETLIVIEATAPLEWKLDRVEARTYLLQVKGKPNLYTGPLLVHDGVVRRVTVEPEAGWIKFGVHLETPVRVEVEFQADRMPVRLLLRCSREVWRRFFASKRIAIDPGHGGEDRGHRGPVDLWERDVAWRTAQEFRCCLERLGTKVVLTRAPEENPSWPERVQRGQGADLFISLHTHGEADQRVRGAAVLYNSDNPMGEEQARAFLEEISLKTKIPRRGVFPSPDLSLIDWCPAFIIETATITNWVDEGVLRNPCFHRKLVLATLSTFFRKYNQPASEVASHVCS